MDSLLQALGNLLAVFKDPVNVLLLFFCIAEGYFIYSLRKENREDKDKLLVALDKFADALEKIRLFLSAHTGEEVSK